MVVVAVVGVGGGVRAGNAGSEGARSERRAVEWPDVSEEWRSEISGEALRVGEERAVPIKRAARRFVGAKGRCRCLDDLEMLPVALRRFGLVRTTFQRPRDRHLGSQTA